MTTTIEINASPVETLPVKLVGEKYTITPPKVAYSLAIARKAQKLSKKGKGTDEQKTEQALRGIDMILEWVEAALPKEEAKRVLDRLEDPHDQLDISHVQKLMQAVIQHQKDQEGNDNPPT